MKRYVLLLALGLVPFCVGFIGDLLIRILPVGGVLALLISLILLILWGYLAFRFSDDKRNAVLQALSLSAVGILMFVLILAQELSLGHYWLNIIGYASQIFFLPVLTVASGIVFSFSKSASMVPVYSVAICLMIAAALIGCLVKRKRNNRC